MPQFRKRSREDGDMGEDIEESWLLQGIYQYHSLML